jgi:rubredoxin
VNASKNSTTSIGYVNKKNGQVVIRNTGLRGTDHGQSVYQLGCSLCGHVYGANGTDIHLRKCPNCQDGKPGLAFK